MSVAETKDSQVLAVLHDLIKVEQYKNCRGTFVYCLLNFPSELSFDLAIDLIISGNFEVAHTAFEIINNTEVNISGNNVEQGFVKLNNAIESSENIDDWRKELIEDVLDMFN